MTLIVGYGLTQVCDYCFGERVDPEETYRDCPNCDGDGITELVNYPTITEDGEGFPCGV